MRRPQARAHDGQPLTQHASHVQSLAVVGYNKSPQTIATFAKRGSLEGKRFLFLSRAQRWVISGVILMVILLAAFTVGYALQRPELQKLADLGGETLKLALTASAGWAFVLLYASSNSPGRIERETREFLQKDLFRPSRHAQLSSSGGFAAIDNELKIDMLPVASSNGSVTYKVSDESGQSMYLWCRLNVTELAVIFILPAAHAEIYEQIYASTLAGFTRRGMDVSSFGLVQHRHDSEHSRHHLELYVSKTLADDFLFNAAARYRMAQSLFGDLRSFLACMRRAAPAAAA